MIRRSLTTIAMIPVALALLSIAGAASGNVILACKNKTNGNLRVVESASRCLNSEEFLSWSIQGPQGTAGQPGPEGPPGPGIDLHWLDNPGVVIPINFGEVQPLAAGNLVVAVGEGQSLLVTAQLELQPPGIDPAAVYPVDLAIYWRRLPAHPSNPTVTLPAGPGIGLPGIHNRREMLHGVIAGLAEGNYEVGIAGLGHPPATLPSGASRFVDVHRIRLSIQLIDPS